MRAWPGSDVICETRALQTAVIPAKAGIHSVDFETLVIPAKAGIHSANLRNCAVHGLDSRFRGNDRPFVRDDIPNDTTTHCPKNDNASQLATDKA